MFGEWWWVRGVMFSRDDDEEPKPVQWKLDGGDICELVDLPAENVISEHLGPPTLHGKRIS